MYLSPEWHEERYGETIFVEETKNEQGKKGKEGNEKYETLSKCYSFSTIFSLENVLIH